MRKYLRYLRIALSVTCGVVCLLLIVLWVRSYRPNGMLLGDNRTYVLPMGSPTGAMYQTSSALGSLYLSRARFDPSINGWRPGQPLNDTVAGFGMAASGGVLSVKFPHWFALFVFATLAAAPWIRQIIRQTKRFSLRTLLIATTLVAVVLGLIVWLSR